MVAHLVREKALGGASGRSGVPRGERFVNEKTTPHYLRTEASVKTKTLLACGVIAGPLFVVVFLVEGATRAHYDPLRHPVSSLAFSDAGWTQRTNFLVTGLLMLAFAIGLRRALRPLGGSTWGPLLVGTCAVGLLGAGIFVADPMNGYPPGTPDKRLDYSTHGVLHDLFSALSSWGCHSPASYSAAGSPRGGSADGRPIRPLQVSSSWVRSSSPARASDRPKAWWT
jgi:hypothetical protein